MPMAELIEWSEFAALEPFGSHFDDLRAGSIAAATYNINRDPQQRSEPFAPLDFMPWNALHEQQQERPVLGAGMDAEQLSALIDAQMFGKS